jgi:hypothetical protein
LPALLESGFVDEIDGKIILHAWDKYTHRYFTSVEKSRRNREKTRERVANFREKKSKEETSEECNAVCNAHVTQAKRNVTPPTIPNLTIPNPTKPNKCFVAPTVEEVRQYCLERGNGIDPQYFFDKNEGIGWVDVRGNKYKDWKAVIRTWEKWQRGDTNESKKRYI